MDKKTYHIETSPIGHDYFFVSTGNFGDISKMVSIIRIRNTLSVGDKELYNLAFGDLKRVGGSLIMDDSVRSNNGDMPKVVATVAKIAILFMKNNKQATLAFEGYWDEKSNGLGRNQRNILYQRAINSNWLELSTDFDISGIRNGHREDYLPGLNYDLILIRHK